MLELKNVSKIYTSPNGQAITAINNVSLQFEESGMVFLLGKSGSGKSTMLNVIGGLDRPDSGEIIVKGKSSKDFTPADFDSYRNTFVGFVFQEYNILEEFSIEDNIALALKLQGKSNDKNQVEKILKMVDLEDYGNRKPNTLSGGQKQRVAIARALIKEPEIIMADEPTGALDSKTGEQIFSMLKELSKTKLVIVVSHDRDFAERFADRIIELEDGCVIADNSKSERTPIVLNDNVSIIDRKIAVIKDVESLKEEDMKQIFSSLSGGSKEVILTTGKEEVEEIKKNFGVTDEGGQRVFSKTRDLELKNYDKDDIKLIKSKLPAKDAFKMGLSGLKIKPVRLIFTILLSVVAFCMFGIMSTLMFYSPAFTMSNALAEKNFKSIVLDKNYSYLHQEIEITDEGQEFENVRETLTSKALYTQEEINKYNKNNLGLNYIGVFNFNTAVAQNNSSGYSISEPRFDSEKGEFYAVRSIFGFSDCGHESIENAGGELLAGRYPESVDEIAITEYVYFLFKDSANVNCSAPKDLLDKPLMISGNGFTNTELKITGVYRFSNFDEYEQYKAKATTQQGNKTRLEKIKELKNYLTKSIDTIGFVSSEFYEANKSKIAARPKGYMPPDVTVGGLSNQLNTEPYMVQKTDTTTEYFPSSVVENYKHVFTFYDLDDNVIDFSLNDDEIFISRKNYSHYCDVYGAEAIKDFKIYLRNYDNNIIILKIKGVFNLDGNPTTEKKIISNSVLEKYGIVKSYKIHKTTSTYSYTDSEKYNYIVSKTNNSEAQISYMLRSDGDVYSVLVNRQYEDFFKQDYLQIINQLKEICIVSAIVVGIFAGLMLLNFISVSIKAKSKEIGILRAVGARGSDVFKIFYAEAFLLTAVCFAIASLLSFIGCLIVNFKIYQITQLVFLKFGIVNVLMILIISFFISFIATTIPVSREAKKPPVEGIRQI